MGSKKQLKEDWRKLLGQSFQAGDLVRFRRTFSPFGTSDLLWKKGQLASIISVESFQGVDGKIHFIAFIEVKEDPKDTVWVPADMLELAQ
jgi:hypothetical protein